MKNCLNWSANEPETALRNFAHGRYSYLCYHKGKTGMNRLNQVFFFTLVGCIVLSGCTRQNKESQAEVSLEKSGPSEETFLTNCIAAQAVVSYFLPKERTYLTDQQHLFCPDSKSLLIHSREPEGTFTWTLTGGQYSHSPSRAGSQTAYWEEPQLLAVYAGFLYGSGLLSADNLAAGSPVNLEGQRYIPMAIEIPGNGIQAYLYRNQDTQAIDRILVHHPSDKPAWMAKCYNWSYYSPKGLLIPRKIDIFDITDGLASKRLIIQIDYKKVP